MTRNPSSSLLGLPLSIRRRIYVEAEVPNECTIDLRTHRQLVHYGVESEIVNLAPAFSLLRTCRTIHDEVFKIFYSSNTFCLAFLGCGSNLTLLQSMPPVSIKTMTRLEIFLDNGSTKRISTDSPYQYPESWRFSRSGAFTPSPTDEAANARILEEWHHAADFIFSHVDPDKLRLGLVCYIDPNRSGSFEIDTQDIDFAQEVVRPLMTCPKLADCKVSFSQSFHVELRRIARQAVVAALRLHDRPFRLLDLPNEIIHNVLAHTNLTLSGHYFRLSSQFSPPTLLFGLHSPGRPQRVARDRHASCCETFVQYCIKSSSWDCSCICSNTPTPLLLACRRLNHLALEVLLKTHKLRTEPWIGVDMTEFIQKHCIPSMLSQSSTFGTCLQWITELEGGFCQ
jgi:hypothetical protein